MLRNDFESATRAASFYDGPGLETAHESGKDEENAGNAESREMQEIQNNGTYLDTPQKF